MPSSKSSHYIIIVVALLIVWMALLFRLNEPFFGHREEGSIWIAAAIRNFNQFGIDAFDYLPVRTPGPSNPETGLYYLHHPPLLVWTNTLGVWLFGYDAATGMPYESSLRMVTLLFTMPTLALMYTMTKRLSNQKTALLAFLLYSFTPMTFYFGRTPYYDMLVLPLVLAFTTVFIGWMRDFSKQSTVMLFILAGLIMWMAWAGAFFLITLGIVALVLGDKRHRLWIVLLGIVTAIVTLCIPLLYEILRPGALSALLEIFIFRTSNASSGPGSAPFTLVQFIGVYLKDMITVVSLAISILGAIGFLIIVKGYKQVNYAVIVALLFAPFLFMLVFRNAFYFHDWYKIHFMPAFAICAASAILAAWRLEPVGLKLYSKPFIMAILICSLGLSVYWLYIMHQVTLDPFGRAIAAELPDYTETDDFIMSNITRPYTPIEYYAYRNVVWGISPQVLVNWYDEQKTVNAYYLLCYELEQENTLFRESPYEDVGTCRLYHIEKSD